MNVLLQNKSNINLLPGQTGEGVSLNRGTLICRVCQRTFTQYKGSKRMGNTNVGWCPEHVKKPSEG